MSRLRLFGSLLRGYSLSSSTSPQLSRKILNYRTMATKSFRYNHTMIRVKDPKVSLKFYTEVVGMELLKEEAFESFTLYYLGFDHSEGALTAEQKTAERFKREGVLELTWNHGTESDASFKGYASGNSEPGKGFGHLAITCDSVEDACAYFEKQGVPFKKRLSDGTMKDIAFILDPDGYWIEVLSNTRK
ncbi:glyoxalase I [Sistotremastrum suecicum HHB10207 ss-3]|uniref:Aldoketomutase n=1 Tax=Sistotremastrum suecicum HHB10207 ss-3 TaxID=1314776 RepID=A0A166IAA7_9AGAM|nr:glyoxalase I [Sistotremastrum suecicum HHB10207 ss-3]